MGDSKIERDSTEVGNRHQGEVGGSRKLTMVSKYQSLETLRSDDKMATRTSKKETRQKNNRFNKQNNNFPRASHLIMYFLPFLYDHDVKMPNLMLYGALKQPTQRFYFPF